MILIQNKPSKIPEIIFFKKETLYSDIDIFLFRTFDQIIPLTDMDKDVNVVL